jgi:hypothetical protein
MEVIQGRFDLIRLTTTLRFALANLTSLPIPAYAGKEPRALRNIYILALAKLQGFEAGKFLPTSEVTTTE